MTGRLPDVPDVPDVPAPPEPPLPALPGPATGALWRGLRDPAEVVHLDVAACGRASRAVLAAMSGHAARESTSGGYVAEAAAAPRLAGARAALARLLGDPALQVALTTGAAEGFRLLLESWPLPAGARVGVLPSEYGGNVMVLRAAQARGEVEVVLLPVDPDGRVDLDALPGVLPGLDLVSLTHLPSHRGLLQPAAEVAAACRAAGVPLLLDAAQTLGQVDCTGIGADAVVGTSRKWLCGPRGVGFVAVSSELLGRLTPRSSGLSGATWGTDGQPVPAPGPARLEPAEVSVAARVGLAEALAELERVGVEPTLERLAALGPWARGALDGVGGWRVGEPRDEPTAVVTLLAPHEGTDVASARARLLEAGLLVTALTRHRAPDDLPREGLRVSLAAWCEAEDVDRLARELGRTSGRW